MQLNENMLKNNLQYLKYRLNHKFTDLEIPLKLVIYSYFFVIYNIIARGIKIHSRIKF